MPAQERGVVKPPNMKGAEFGTDQRANGFLPLADRGSTVRGSDYGAGDRRGGSYPLGGSASPISPPNQMGGDRRGYSSDGQMPAAVEPGKGAVAVNPTTGLAIGTMPIADMAPPSGPTK